MEGRELAVHRLRLRLRRFRSKLRQLTANKYPRYTLNTDAFEYLREIPGDGDGTYYLQGIHWQARGYSREDEDIG